jgi:hypothetical protein
VTDTTAVHAIIPMSLLEALRNLDTPVEDGLEELAGEIVSKRLGLSTTVAAQIARYQETARHGGLVPLEEALAVFRLAGRRPDSALVFADAGRRAARYSARTNPIPVRVAVGLSPSGLRRPIGGRAAAAAARRILRSELRVGPTTAEARAGSSLAMQALPDGRGCAFYGAAFNELLRCLTGFEGAMVHERCRARGDTQCRWKAAAGGGYE